MKQLILSSFNSTTVTYGQLKDYGEYQEPAEANSLGRKGWAIRILMLSLISCFLVYNSFQIAEGHLVLISVYAIFALSLSAFIFIIGWLSYRRSATMGSVSAIQDVAGGANAQELVSVIIPVYNQASLIEPVLDAVYSSSYKSIEVVVVNDGSTDNTGAILDRLASEKFPKLIVLHVQKNAGKRKAVAFGIMTAAKGDYIVLIDSDSMIEKNAILAMMRAFTENPRLGAIAGQGKVWNAEKNHLTKWQEVWYDFAFNIQKSCESYFGVVTCCSGCLAAYRSNAILGLVEYWNSSKGEIEFPRQELEVNDKFTLSHGQKPISKRHHEGKRAANNDEGMSLATTSSVIERNELSTNPPFRGNGLSKRLFYSMANYDDCEDGALTAYTLTNWETVYLPNAIVHTEIPDNNRAYFRQQQRWKKGYLRAALFASTFIWRKENPVISLMFYTQLVSAFTLPVVMSLILIFVPLGYYDIWTALAFIASIMVIGLLKGVDYWIKSGRHRHFLYGPVMEFISSFILPWLIIPAIANYKKNKWLTR